MSGQELHQSAVFLPPAGGPRAQLQTGRGGKSRPDLLSPQPVTASYAQPPPAHQGAGQRVRTGQPGEDGQQDVLVQVPPVRHDPQGRRAGHHRLTGTADCTGAV